MQLNRKNIAVDEFRSEPGKESATSLPADDILTAAVTVKNTGNCTGTEVVQLYIHDCVSSLARPVRELKGFQRITLSPGEEKEAVFKITEEMLYFTGPDGSRILEPGTFEVWIGNSSETDNKEEFTLMKH